MLPQTPDLKIKRFLWRWKVCLAGAWLWRTFIYSMFKSHTAALRTSGHRWMWLMLSRRPSPSLFALSMWSDVCHCDLLLHDCGCNDPDESLRHILTRFHAHVLTCCVPLRFSGNECWRRSLGKHLNPTHISELMSPHRVCKSFYVLSLCY